MLLPMRTLWTKLEKDGGFGEGVRPQEALFRAQTNKEDTRNTYQPKGKEATLMEKRVKGVNRWFTGEETPNGAQVYEETLMMKGRNAKQKNKRPL